MSSLKKIKKIKNSSAACLMEYAFYMITSSNGDIFPRYRPFVRAIHRSPVISPRKGQWRGALMFSLIWVWINGWVNNREAGDLRRHRAHCDVIVMITNHSHISLNVSITNGWRRLITLQWRNGVSNRLQFNYFFNSLLRITPKKTARSPLLNSVERTIGDVRKWL